MKVKDRNTITGEVRVRLSYVELGNKMLKSYGRDACINGYGTDDPEWLGRYALSYGDINADGSTN